MKGDVVFERNGTIYLQGELDFVTATKILTRADKLLKKKRQWLIDFTYIEGTNSCGLALIVEWIKRAKLLKKQLHLANIPSELIKIAEVAGLDEVMQRYILEKKEAL